MAKSLEEKKRDARIQKQIENLGGKAKPPEPKTLRDALKREKLKAKMTQSASNFMEEYGFEKPTVEDRTLALMKGRRGVYNKNVPKELRDREKYEMKDGGDVPMPKRRPKNFKKTVEKQKRDKAIADGDMTIGDFNEMTPSMMQDFYKNASKVKKMKLGGEAVPSKFKGFSKLPEGVQQKIDPKLASKYEMGGKVEEYGGGGKVKGGKMSCRGMGAAIKGGGFSIR